MLTTTGLEHHQVKREVTDVPLQEPGDGVPVLFRFFRNWAKMAFPGARLHINFFYSL